MGFEIIDEAPQAIIKSNGRAGSEKSVRLYYETTGLFEEEDRGQNRR